jgi:hypothetical protein
MANPVYGYYPHLNPKVANKPDTLNTPEAKGKLAETLLSMAPGSGEALSLRDAWNASGKGAEALTGGNYGQAASEYGNLATALLASLPGAGVIARGTKRGAEWMNQNLPTGVNKLVDALMPSDPKNTLNIFAGPTAKTADTAALAKAEEMATSGASRDDIWNQTGWFQGNDGKWRFEIDDSTAGLKNDEQFIAEFGPSKGQPVNRFEGLDHPGLSAAYPNLADEISFAGLYAPNRETLGVFSPSGGRMEVTAGTHDAALSAALHEHQHAIQSKEGFANGGNWRQLAAEDPATASYAENLYQDMKARGVDLADEDMRANAMTMAARKRYNDISGEVEARNVQTRMNMNADERRAKAPWLTQDVPDDQQIFRFR